MAILGKRLKKARNDAGYTQMEAAKKLGISNGTLSGYERNYRDPDTETLNMMANLFDVTTDYLVGRSDDPRMTADEEFDAFANDPELGRWYRELPESDEEDLRKLRDMWEIMKRDVREK